MPIYEFGCKDCGNEFEELVFSRDAVPPCPRCGSMQTEKLMSACASRVQGSGPDPEVLKNLSCGSGGG
ncbi:FmdB family zinc ribbon protein [Pseudodesulfovibrio indicus]|uniref:FmdB family regulatory protein n=1 Tax=Pseudodesulfovibrio indicus TaxID=1716143 RepID=A0A126QKS3_9BACT|nr:zinc ribbon domain-containing protein [Pseudodesulfovibrio indicus]AMK10640.1 hypothetical protein AWY79_05695 [Pseudodesulfovibrio indicus]TDT91612.1 putative FmdB family regulatory protein [Pseudodesulfovibrio indicus]